MSVKIEEVGQAPANEAILRAVLRPTAPFNFKQAIDFIKVSGANDKADIFAEDARWLERAVWLDGKPFLLRLTNLSESEDDPLLQLDLQADDAADTPPDEVALRQAAEWADRRFYLSLDMHAVREALAINEYGEELVGRFWPARPVNLSDAWAGLLRTVIGNQVFPGLAMRMQQSLLDFYGKVARFDGKEYRTFPDAAKLATVAPDELTTMKFSRQKASFLPGIAQAVLADPDKYNWERLRSLPGTEAVAILDELPGVGPWTAHYVAMRGLPHQDVFIDEEGLRKTLATAFDRKAALSSQDAAKMMAVYAPYRTFACYYTYMLMYAA